MKRKQTHSIFQVDTLYVLLIVITVVAMMAVFVVKVPDRAMYGILNGPTLASWNSSLGYGLALLALAVLSWRVWMVLRYRSCAQVSDDTLPTVTIIIPAFNEGSQVLTTIRSVMESRYPQEKMEVVCIDDGSSDDTWHWMGEAFREFPRRIQLVRQAQNQGKRHALMAGFLSASGDVFVTIDSDSEVLPETLRHLVSPFAVNPQVGAVAGNVRVLNRHAGPIPKMMEVYFTMAFDLVRAGQSVFGGVVCSPGALSAYRASVIRDHLPQWISQSFMGKAANIGEDRALTNCVLRKGYRVVYQREAVVLTQVPATYRGLRRMLMRWSRSNVRESLVMATFIFRRFRGGRNGEGWIRLCGLLCLFELAWGQAMKLGLLAFLVRKPVAVLTALLLGCLMKSVIPAVVYQIRYHNWFGWRWAASYSIFWVFALSWISAWALFSAARSGWLTRGAPAPSRYGMGPMWKALVGGSSLTVRNWWMGVLKLVYAKPGRRPLIHDRRPAEAGKHGSGMPL